MSIKVDVKVEGLDEVVKAFSDKFGWRKTSAAVAAGLYAAGGDIMRVAKRLAPQDTGWLRNTGYITQPDPRSPDPECEAGFYASYAQFVHDAPEGTRFQVGERKFLEKAVNRQSKQILARVSTLMKMLLQTGITPLPVATGFKNRPQGNGRRPKSWSKKSKRWGK